MLFRFIPNISKSGCMSAEKGMHSIHRGLNSLSSVSEMQYDVLNAAVS